MVLAVVLMLIGLTALLAVLLICIEEARQRRHQQRRALERVLVVQAASQRMRAVSRQAMDIMFNELRRRQ